MKNFKSIALAGVLALSTSFVSPAYADSIGCTSDGTTAAEITALQEVEAALQQWLSERTPADPNYQTITGNLTDVQMWLTMVQNGYTPTGSKPPFSLTACNIDVSPA